MTAAVDNLQRDACRPLLGKLLNLEWPTRRAALLQPFGTAVRAEVAAAATALADPLTGHRTWCAASPTSSAAWPRPTAARRSDQRTQPP